MGVRVENVMCRERLGFLKILEEGVGQLKGVREIQCSRGEENFVVEGGKEGDVGMKFFRRIFVGFVI